MAIKWPHGHLCRDAQPLLYSRLSHDVTKIQTKKLSISSEFLLSRGVTAPKNLYYWAACGRPSRYFGFWSFSYKNEHPGEETHEVWDREMVFSQVVSYDFLLHKYFCFFFVCLTAFSRIIFSIPFGASSNQIVDKRNLTEFSFQAFITEFKFRSNLG